MHELVVGAQVLTFPFPICPPLFFDKSVDLKVGQSSTLGLHDLHST